MNSSFLLVLIGLLVQVAANGHQRIIFQLSASVENNVVEQSQEIMSRIATDLNSRKKEKIEQHFTSSCSVFDCRNLNTGHKCSIIVASMPIFAKLQINVVDAAVHGDIIAMRVIFEFIRMGHRRQSEADIYFNKKENKISNLKIVDCEDDDHKHKGKQVMKLFK